MKRKKNIKGFTLIELIVVIAIIGVLAAILVPAMMGWVRKSQITTNNNNASEVCTQLQIIFTDIDSTRRGALDTNCVIEYDGHAITSTSDLDDDLEAEIMAINSKMTDMSKAKWAAEIKNNTVEAVVFTNNDYRQVGGFPKQCTADYVTAGKDISTFLNCAKTSW